MPENFILDRLNALERRLAQLEARLGAGSPSEKPVPTVHEEVISPVRETVSPFRSEGVGTSRVLGIVGALCFVGAAAFLIKLAIQSGWLTPERQVGLASLFGLALIIAGLYYRAKDSEYLGLLPGAGIVVLYLASQGGCFLHGLFPPEVSVGASAGISVLSLYLFSQFRSVFYVLLSVIGSYSSLALLDASVSPAALTTYYLVWAICFSVVGVELRTRLVLLLAAYLGLAGYQAKMLAFIWQEEAVLGLILWVQAVQFFIFVIATGKYSIKHRSPLTTGEAWAFFPLLLFFYGLEYFVLVRWNTALAPYFAPSFAAILYGLYFIARKRLGEARLASASLVSTFGSVVAFHSVYLEILSDRIQMWLGPVVLLAGPYIWKRLRLEKAHFAYGMLIAAIVSYSYASVLLGGYGEKIEQVWLGAFFVIALWGFYSKLVEAKELRGVWDLAFLGFLTLAAAHAQYMTATYRLIGELSLYIDWVDAMSAFLLSSLWGLYGLGTLWSSQVKKDKVLARSALCLLAVTSLKVFLFDVASSSPVMRIFCLLIMGLVLYAGGYVVIHVNSWQKTS